MDDLITYLCNYAYDHKIGFILNRQKLSSDEVPISSYALNLIIVNMNWNPETEIPFQFAHEISHILNGDKGDKGFPAAIIKEEYAANKRAIDILMKYAELNEIPTNNVVKFMNIFGIPYKLEDLVRNELLKNSIAV
ncbi:ImmA/IrrE family metallo-endopeptidase [Lentilactobacillus kosonis]|uniref:IrrE N-terminal-like domain-containing protein n=1 Tax=Lentilactobacillus kosonis TaxID=2810561 RepID=A0A401FPJ9_9LACO|nr:ImmA/IrrE family metallo-endopeptidase [Lentilactobacillus kosonis]GAY74310.1 hypothetical protein NBRC111893_2456 [Lentilactobacillus kosonis]